MIDSGIFSKTLFALEDGLRVELIATSPLVDCEYQSNLGVRMREPEFQDYDYVPVRKEGRIVSVYDREGINPDGHVEIPLHEGLLVSSDMPLLNFLPCMAKEPFFRLVIYGDTIKGIVTRSDLLKLPVRILAFTYITHLERVMASIIIKKFGEEDNSWQNILTEKRQKELLDNQRSDEKAKLNLPLLDKTEFGDKSNIVRKALGLGRDFKSDLHLLKIIRNKVTHARGYADTQEDLKNFINLLESAKHWIRELEVQLQV